jgi:uncharacterized protein
MRQRIIGFDLARAYAILGMFVVNFTFSFGSFAGKTFLHKFTLLFVGNSTSIFIICAGMGLALMTNRDTYEEDEKSNLKSIILKRSWFLFFLGLLLYNWWPGDILHFYGGYMHIAAFLIFMPRQTYLWAGLFAIIFYILLQFLIPVTTSWDMASTKYADFWTPIGFLRNTFYNGWNSIFPWFAYFSIGMYIGRLNWQNKTIQRKMFFIGLGSLSIFKGLRFFIQYDFNNVVRNAFYTKYWGQIMEDYFPVSVTFFFITIGWAFMVISLCMYLGDKFKERKMTKILAITGQMTLSHYVIHLTVGVYLFAQLFNMNYTGLVPTGKIIEPKYILIYAFLYFIASVIFSFLWSKKFRNGPLETLMRRISNK